MYRIEPLTDDSPRRPLRRRRTSPVRLEHVLFALGGTMTLLSALLVALVSPWFLLLTAFVGVNQWLYVLFGACPASIVLQRMLGPEVTK